MLLRVADRSCSFYGNEQDPLVPRETGSAGEIKVGASSSGEKAASNLPRNYHGHVENVIKRESDLPAKEQDFHEPRKSSCKTPSGSDRMGRFSR